ncbi:Putative epidermal cell surface receptor [Frankliniella fusca]|uniref:Epidermal cell surface receptor n=1 Tax=Frankliniella fusca TaxID=407009 RepID=A0AAE1LLL4_9NEOP|nr:Putative epidermal cell surface receptor [Frankliniella fusca]
MGDDSGNASLADVDGNGHPEATTLRAKAMKAAGASVSGERRLDDVSMDDDDNTEGMSLTVGNASAASSSSPRPAATAASSSFSTSASTTTPSTSTTTTPASLPTIVDGAVMPSTALPTCVDTDGKVYVEGQRFSKACDQMCSCAGGSVTCSPRCKAPFMRRGARADPLCVEKDSDDPCCVLMVCPSEAEAETEPVESCTFKNKTYHRGQTFFDACESTCSCGEAGNVTCKPRCPPTEAKLSDRCVAVPDKTDLCCTVVLCDVTLGDEVAKPSMGAEDASSAMRLQLGGADVLNSTAVRLSLPGGDLPDNVTAEASLDGRVWSRQEVAHQAGAPVLSGLQPGRTYFIRLRGWPADMMGNTVEVSLPAAPATSPAPAPASSTAAPAGPAGPASPGTTAGSAAQCTYKGKSYALDEEFHDGCLAICACTATGMQCAPLECPTDFGLDLLDPECLDWETVPRNFVPQPPHCCPERVSCRNNGSCAYAGQRFPNFSEIPTKVTGCDQRCYCEYGNVTCEAVCPPVPPAPPAGLPCEPHQAIVGHQHGDDCCLFWMCPQPVPHFGGHPGNETGPAERPPASPAPSPSKASFPLVLAPTPAPTSSPPAAAAAPGGPVGVLAPGPAVPTPGPAPGAPFPGPFAPPKSPQPAFLGPFAPTLTPPAKGKPHKTHYIGPFRIDDDDDKENGTPLKGQGPEAEQPSKPIKRPPSDHDYEDHGDEEQHFHPQQIHGHAGPYFPLSPDKKNVNPEYQIIAVVPHNAAQGIPQHPHQGVPVPPYHQGGRPYQELPGRGGGLPQGLPPHQGHPTPEDLLYLQHVHGQDGVHVIQQGGPHGAPQGVPQGPQGTDLFLLHNQQGLHGLQGDKVYHVDVAPQGPQGQQHHDVSAGLPPGVPPGLHEQIIAHLREAGALRPNKQQQQQQQPPARPLPLPYPHPPQHGQGLGLEHEDDLATDTSRHPAQLQQQLAQLLGNHSSYSSGFPEGPLPPGFPQHPSIGRQDEVTVQTLEAVDETTVRLVFSVPPVLVGLHGRVELRYTSDVQNDEPATWDQQVLAPPNDLIATPQLEFELGGLQPDTVYKIKITVILRDLHNTPSSKDDLDTNAQLSLSHSQPPPPPRSPRRSPIDAELTVAEVNASWARLTWRKATPFEINFIDGVQLRYKEIDGKVYAATPLIHRAVTSYTLEGLRPDTQYEVGIYFIPFTGQTTELLSERTVTFTTGIENDPYKFELTLDVHHIKSTSVELSWQGVPYPEDKFVNIFRAIYQSDAGKEDFSSFKIAKRDSPPKTMIQDLKPGTRYRLWLEAYLTNGRIKKSNVQDFLTKPGSAPTAAGSTQQGKLEGTPLAEVSDYYGPLVAVAIIATLAILTSLILTLLLMKKCAQSKAAISTCRKSQSAYDNPSYKTSEKETTTSNGRSRNARDSVDNA